METKHTPGNALIVGEEYIIDGYGRAKYDGMLMPDSGWLWKFTACENRNQMKSNMVFTIQYSGLGIKAERA